ncbi:MAG: hypothetical protein ABI618_16085 [Nitrospirota bacterium]
MAILFQGCVVTKPFQYEEGPDGNRYYRTTEGDTLRVDREGRVYGYPGNKRFEPGEHGTASKVKDEWDMAKFGVKEHATGCKVIFIPFFSSEKAHGDIESCWNRVWEVPAIIVATPFLLVGALALMVVEIAHAISQGGRV